MTDRYIRGDYNSACFECGRKFHDSELRWHWKGYKVCPDHWEERHPQDFVGGVPGTDAPKWVQPLPIAYIDVPQAFPPKSLEDEIG